MATSYTSLLGFALPVTGELQGTWGDTVNNSITQLCEDSIAGVATQSVLSADWTLTTTGTGLANQARMAILIPTGSPGVSRNIIAPSKSKAYIVINQSNAAVIIKGAATTGVTIASGENVIVAWNGSDFIRAYSSIYSASAFSYSVTSGAFLDYSATAARIGVGTGSGNVIPFSAKATGQINLTPLAAAPAGAAGDIYYNSTTNQFQGYNGTSWLPVGGASISNDTTTASNLYPIFANATTGTATTVYTGNAKLLYKPSTGELSSTAVVSTNGITINSATIAADYTIATGNNGCSAGPVTVNSGITVTVSSGSTWVVV